MNLKVQKYLNSSICHHHHICLNYADREFQSHKSDNDSHESEYE